MQSGLVAKVHGDFDSIPEDNFPIVRGNGLKTSLSIRDRTQNESGDTILTGVAAEEKRTDEETSEITDDGRIRDGISQTRTETIFSQFVTIPGEFVVIGSSNAEFALELIGKSTNSAVSAFNFNLNAIANDYADDRANIWMTGFYDYDGNANTGVAYGDDVYDDADIGPIVRDGLMNQLGMTIERGESEVKLMITESGYIRVYSPSEYGTPSFVRLVKEFITEYGLEDDKR